MKVKRLFLLAVPCTVLSGLVLLFSALGPDAMSTPTSVGSVEAAWRRARETGSYSFSADIVQRSAPLPTVTNAGRRSRQDSLHLEGQADLPHRAMQFTIWSQGGSVLSAESGAQVRLEGDRAFVREAAGEWQEIDNFAGAFAPSGDFLAFLSAAADIAEQGTQTRSGVALTRYTFRVDGPGFAAYVRDQMEQHLAERGELPPGVTLDLPRAYADMTGTGELWIGADCLPLRQILHLQFPPREDYRIEAEVAVDFSDFGAVSVATEQSGTAQGKGELRNSPPRVGEEPGEGSAHADSRSLAQVAAIVLMSAFALVLIRSHSRRLYTALALVLVVSMVVSPVAQAQQAAAFYDRQAARAQEQKAAEEQHALLDEVSTRNFDPHVDRLAATPIHVASRASATGLPLVAAQTTPDTAICSVAESEFLPGTTQDSDSDGLTDYQECILGSDPFFFDTDGDTITDTLEVQGFTYGVTSGGQPRRWYSDPLALDTDQDGIGDVQEWLIDADNNGVPDDTDGDGTPDLFDDDNDGDGVRDKLDLSPFEATARVDDSTGNIRASTRVFSESDPLSVIVNGLQPGTTTYLEFQVRPTNPDHLWYAFNVLDWPQGDDEGQVRDVDGATFASGDMDAAPTEANGDLKLVPMLEILLTGETDNLPPASELSNYGIAIQTAQQAGSASGITQTVKAAYLPLQLVIDPRSGARQAFYGKMLYRPAAEWGDAQEVRLVWAIQGLVDVCQEEGEAGCSDYEHNQVQVLHTYYDEWFLAGLSVREDHGADIAIVYEDPTRDTDRNDDNVLVGLLNVLDNTFLIGSDCAQTPSGRSCRVGEGDGQRDLVVVRPSVDSTSQQLDERFDHTRNGEGQEIAAWGLPNILRVRTESYRHHDEAIVTTAMTVTRDILDSAFTAYVPVTPTLLFAREERARTLNLEERRFSQAVALQGAQLRLNMDAPPDRMPGGRQVETIAGVSWAPYRRVGGAWEAMPIADYWDELARRYTDPNDPESGESIARVLAMSAYYLGLYNGFFNGVQTGDRLLLPPTLSALDADIQAALDRIFKVPGGQGVEITANYVLGKMFPDIPAAEIGDIAAKNFNLDVGDFPRAFRTPAVQQFLAKANTALLRANRLNQASAAIGAVAFVLGLTNLTIIALKEGNVGGQRRVFTVINQALNLAVNTLNAIATGITIAQQIIVKAIDVGYLRAFGKVLGGGQLTRANVGGAVIGLIIAIGVTWGVFIYTVVSNNIEPGTPVFNTLLATAVAATVVAILFFVLSLTTVGLILVALIGVIDALLELLGVDFGISKWLTEQLAKAFYGFDEQLTVEITDSQMGALDVDLLDPGIGLRAGNTLVVTSSLTTTITHDDPDDDFFDNAELFHVSEFWTVDNLQSTQLNYAFSVKPDENTTTWQTEFDHTYTRKGGFGSTLVEQSMYRGRSHQPTVTGRADLIAGVNVRPVAQLVTRYNLPSAECERILDVADCDEKRTTGNSATNLGLVFDVFPADVTRFYSLTWGAWAGLIVPNYVRDDGSFNIRSGGMAFGVQRDHDGDGLIALAHGGNDPNDQEWDSDGDGLADAFELKLRAEGFAVDPTDDDSDNDCQLINVDACLTDGEEQRLGSDPSRIDSDGDGLTDKEEVFGWMFTYDANLTTTITSDPLLADTDGDGMDDKSERDLHRSNVSDFPYHPRVFNEQPVALSTSVGGASVVVDQGLAFAPPGAAIAYTATVRNNIEPAIYALGTLTVSLPGVLGGAVNTYTIDYYGGEARSFRTDATVSPGASSQTADIRDEVLARLQPDLPESGWVMQTVSDRIVRSDAEYTKTLFTAIVPAPPGWNAPYVMAAVEARPRPPNQEPDAPDIRVVFFPAGDQAGTGVMLDNIGKNVQSGDDLDRYTIDMACADDGKCLVAWSRLVSARPTDYFAIFGAIVSPGGAVRQITIRNQADEQDDNVRPSIASDGTNFMVAWLRDPDLGSDNLQAQRFSNTGDALGQLFVDINKDSFQALARSLDLAYAGTSGAGQPRSILVWNEAQGSDMRIFKTFLNADGPDPDGPTQAIELDSALGLTNLQVAHDTTGQLGGMVSYINNPGDETPAMASIPPSGQAQCQRTFGTGDVDDGLRLALHAESQSWIVAHTVRPFGSNNVRVQYQAFAPDCSPRTNPETFRAGDIVANVLSLACRSGGCAWAAVRATQIFRRQFDLIEFLPAQGELSQSRIDYLTIDNEPPASSFDVSALTIGALPDASVLVVGGSASDPTSGIGRVEVSADGGNTWQPAAGLETWTYAFSVPTGAGRYTLLSRAFDRVGHAQNLPLGQMTIGVIGGPPQLDTPIADNDLLPATFDPADLRWRIPISGTAADVGGGVQRVEVNVAPNGSGWQPAAIVTATTPNAWSIDYPLASFDREANALVDPSGAYTLTVRASDRAGNATPASQYLTRIIRIDTAAPVAQLTAIGPSIPGDVRVISQSLTLSGVVSETSNFGAGVSGVEISFTDVQPVTPTQVWQPALVGPPSGPGVLNTTWSYSVPASLEGFYQIDARGGDVASNRTEDQSAWGQWRGEVDRLAPRIVVTATFEGISSTARTRYEMTATDLNLIESSVDFPVCGPRARVERTYYDTPWYRDHGGDPTRLYQLTLSCRRPQHRTGSFTVRACDAFGHCAETTVTPSGEVRARPALRPEGSEGVPKGGLRAVVAATSLAGHDDGEASAGQAAAPPLLDAAIFEPEDNSVLTATTPVGVSGGAYARDSLQSLTVTADGAVIFTQNWAAGTVIDTAWSTTWTPGGEGAHTLLAVVSDWAGRVLTDTSPIVVTLDTQDPSVAISNTLINTGDLVTFNRVNLTGAASDAGGVERVNVRIDGGAWENAWLEGDGSDAVTWRFPWLLNRPTADAYTVTARATDVAGRATLVTQTVAVDIVPPQPVTVTLSYRDTANTVRPLAPRQTVRDAQSLIIEWTESADENGLADYLVGWADGPTPDPAALTAYATAGQPHTQPAGEAQALFAHVAAQDASGNRRWHTLGPVVIDAPATPDFIADLTYHGWLESPCAQVGADREVMRNAAAGAALHEIQRLYLAWSDDALRVTWTGANWDEDGDLFIYFDTTAGGAVTATDPYPTPGPAIGLPVPLAADYGVWLEDRSTARLLQWTGTAWTEVSAWAAGDASGQRFFRLDTRPALPHTDVLVPFAMLGNPSSLRLVALASEEDALRIWAAMPDKNPLNSTRVINPLATGFVSGGFDLTQHFAWTSLGSGECPNAGQFADTDLRLGLRAEPTGVTAGFLEDDWLDLLAPNARLDANLDGVVDQPLPIDIVPTPLGAGQAVTYMLVYANEGAQAATGVRVNLAAYGALQLTGGNVIDLGTIAAGAIGEAQFTAQIADAGDRAAELVAVVSDATHGDPSAVLRAGFDWLWAQHPIDRDPPSGLAIRAPLGFVRPFSNTLSGVANDASGVREVRLEAQPLAGSTPVGAPMVTGCPDASPQDGEWSCIWNVIASPGIDAFRVRAQAIDLFGNTSGFTAPLTLRLDATSPTVSLDSDTQQALADGILTPGEFILGGRVQDNFQAAGVTLCFERASGQNCVDVGAQPGNTPSGAWRFALPVFTADGVTETLSIVGRDAAGNASPTPLTRTYELDNVGPQVTVTRARAVVLLSSYLPGSASATPVLSGTVVDANGVARMLLRMDTPTGESRWLPLMPTGDRWSFTPQLADDPSSLGLYRMRIYAWDQVNNARGYGPFELRVIGEGIAVDAGEDQTAGEGTLVTVSATFDSSADVTHTATINWGDGTLTETMPVARARARLSERPQFVVYLPLVGNHASASSEAAMVDGSVPGTHVYADDRAYTVEVCISDGSTTACDTLTVTVNNVAPTVDAGTDRTVNEGDVVSLPPATFNDKGTLDTHTATIDWGDGTPVEAGIVNESPFGPPGSTAGANGSVSGSHVYADDGAYPVTLCVADDDGATTCDTLAVSAGNLAPAVDAGADQAVDEGDTVSLAASFTDKGTLDTHTATIDWGDGTPPEAGVVSESPFGPPGSPSGMRGTVSSSHVYGDNGAFSVEVCVEDDDDATGCGTLTVTVNNVDPTADIDRRGALFINGVPTFLARAGQTVEFRGRSTDPGSDDLYLSWDWDDGPPSPDVIATYLVNSLLPDPFPSPSVQPRDVIDVQSHAFADACLFDVRFFARDDDGGRSPTDNVSVLIVGNADRARSSGYWQHQLGRQGHTDFDEATLECYLAIIDHVSTVFSEARDASTIAAAYDVLFMAHNGGSPRQRFDRALLTVWLNFANGAMGYDEHFDTDGDGQADATFAGAVSVAEAVRLDLLATDADIEAQRAVLQRLNR